MTLSFNLPHMSKFRRDTRLLLIAVGIFSVSFFGIQQLLRVLYMLRLGYSLEYIGLFSATGALGYMTMSIPSGALSVRFGIRPVMLAGGIIAVIGMVIFPLTEFLPVWANRAWPIISQIVLTGGWAIFNVNLVPALMALSTPENRNQAYAINGMFRGLGTFVGTIVGGFLPGLFAYVVGQPVDTPFPYGLSLWLGAIIALAGLIPMFRVSPIKGETNLTGESDTEPFPTWPLALILAHVYLSHGAWAACQAFCNAYMDTDLHLSTAAIGLIVGVGQFATIVAPLLNPQLASRHSNGWILMAATLGISLSLLPLVLLTHWAAVGLGRLGVMALAAIWMPASQVYIMEMVGNRWRSLVYGIVSMAMGFTFASVSLAGGYIAAGWGYRSLFLGGLVISLLGVVLMWLMLNKSHLIAPVQSVSREKGYSLRSK
jgi:MFS family permease